MEHDHSHRGKRTMSPESAQPISVEDRNLDFTDSAVDMNASTPGASDDEREGGQYEHDSQITSTMHSLISYARSLSERLDEFSTQALGGTSNTSPQQANRLGNALRQLNAVFDDGAPTEDDVAITRAGQQEEEDQDRTRDQNATEEAIDKVKETDLMHIHENLADVVASMRLRQQEQRHLHQLTARKIEAVAQKCLSQEQVIQDMAEEMRNLRVENQTLGHENDTLRNTIAELESEASKNQVAVSAMTSAVAGLEGWIDDADRTRVENYAAITPRRNSRQRLPIIRGRGRFRGRYYVEHNPDQAADVIGSETQDLHDGVKAWIRGFRDVEDACNSPFEGDPKDFCHGSNTIEEDEWGDFVRPSRFSH